MKKKTASDALSSIGEMDFLDRLSEGSTDADNSLDALDGLGIGGGKVNHYKDVKYKGKAELDTKAELTATQQAFRKARARETEQRQEMTDAAFYFCVVFETSAQKEEFIRKLAVQTKEDDTTMWINGFALAKKLGIKLTTPRIKWTVARNDTSWADEIGTLQ